VLVIDTRNEAHWAECNWQFIWAARNFARKTNAVVLLEYGKQGTISYNLRHSVDNTIFLIIPEIPSKRVHSKRIPKLSKTFPGIFTVPFNIGPEISEFLIEWKAPAKAVFFKLDTRNVHHIRN